VPTATAVPHQTALHGAAQRGFTPFVKFLAENGADVQAKDANGRTPLDLAKASKEPLTETVKLLESLMATP
jgi:ankyrin repeat protein